MDHAVTCDFRWTLEEFLTAQRLSIRYSRSARILIWIMRLIGGSFVLAGAIRTVNVGFDKWVAAMVIGGCIFLAATLSKHRFLARQYERIPEKDSHVRWEAFPDRFVIKTAASCYETSWSVITRVVRTPQGFFVYPQRYLWYWLPAHAFKNPADTERFAQFAQAKVAQYEEVG
ncbi:MAG: YcxB family protein [Planctomycetes bacterium]|nr:YcxB family protein [Planctomycetota bacterium]